MRFCQPRCSVGQKYLNFRAKNSIFQLKLIFTQIYFLAKKSEFHLVSFKINLPINCMIIWSIIGWYTIALMIVGRRENGTSSTKSVQNCINRCGESSGSEAHESGSGTYATIHSATRNTSMDIVWSGRWTIQFGKTESAITWTWIHMIDSSTSSLSVKETFSLIHTDPKPSKFGCKKSDFEGKFYRIEYVWIFAPKFHFLYLSKLEGLGSISQEVSGSNPNSVFLWFLPTRGFEPWTFWVVFDINSRGSGFESNKGQFCFTNLNVNDEGFVNWWEKFWNAMEAVCVKSVDGLFGVGGNLRWPWPLIWALTWLVLWFMVGCWVPLPTPSFPNKLGWLKLEK